MDKKPVDDKAVAERLDRYREIVTRLEAMATKRVAQRAPIEQRWIEDLRQYHGKYTEDVEEHLRRAERSSVFANRTRAMTRKLAARLADMLFPVDDRSYAVESTAVPALSAEAKEAARRAKQARQQAEQAAMQPPEGQMPAGPAGMPPQMGGNGGPPLDPAAEEAVALSLQEAAEEAKRRAARMEDEIDDVLQQSQYPQLARQVLRDGCKIGCGVVKAPVIGDRVRKGWQMQEGGGSSGEVQGQGAEEVGPDGFGFVASDGQPTVRRVDPWAFFPDMDAATLEDGEGILERHLLNPSGMRRFAAMPGVDKDAVRRLLKIGPKDYAPGYLASLDEIVGQKTDRAEPRYTVWEYSGPIPAADLAVIYGQKGDEEGLAEVGEDADPLEERMVRLWWCSSEVLKVGPYPLDSEEPLYSLFCIEPDESSPFGLGIPAIMRDEQRILNAAWRALMDHTAAAVGPQIVIDESQVTPVDGGYDVRGMKLWRRNKGAVASTPAFEQFVFDPAIRELSAIIELAERQADVAVSMPEIAQGEEPGTGVQQTATGTALLMSSANVVFRDIVRAWDDRITVPVIRRLYDHLMQHSPRDDIKGDYEVQARGASVLMAREMQGQNLFVLLQVLGQDPEATPGLKKQAVVRDILRSMSLSPDEYLPTEEEMEEAGAAPDPAMEQMNADMEMRLEELRLREAEIQMKAEIANLEAGARVEVARMNQETAMMQAAEKSNMTMEQLRAQIERDRLAADTSERKLAAEIGMRNQTGVSSGGAV